MSGASFCRTWGRWLIGVGIALVLMLAPTLAFAAQGEPRAWTEELATQRLRVGRVELLYEPHLEPGAIKLAQSIPQWWSEIEQIVALDLEDDLTIIYVEYAGQIAEASGMPRWVSGVAHGPSGRIMVARHGPDGTPTQLDALIRHEMGHIALYRATGGQAVPRWFNEGLAESVEENIDIARAQALANMVYGTGVPSLAQIERQFRALDHHLASNAYAAARDLVNELRFRDGDGHQLRQALTEMRLGHDFNTAMQRAYGAPLVDLVAEWRAGLPAKFFWYPLLAAGGGLPTVILVPLLVAAWIRRRRQLAADWARLEREDDLLRERLGLSDVGGPWASMVVPSP